MQQGGSEIRLLISRCQPQQLKIDQEQRKQTMRKLGIALLLGILTGSALAISVGIEQSLTAETRDIQSHRAETAIHLTPQEAHQLIETNRTHPHLIILDVRTPREFSQGHLEKANNINFHAQTFRQDINQLDREKTYLIYCRRGVRSDRALMLMQEMGFQPVYNLLGGTARWQREGFSTAL